MQKTDNWQCLKSGKASVDILGLMWNNILRKINIVSFIKMSFETEQT